MAEPIIELEDVSLCYRLAKQRIGSIKEYFIHLVKGALTYEELWALDNVTLQVERGEMVGVVGPNGAGKSTLSKVISGVLKPTRGRRRVEGVIAPILELGTGFDFELTGLENIYLNALLLGRQRREIEAKVDAIIDFSGLGDFIHAPVRNYSTGMVARLGFSVATAWVPDILVLDEVLAVGDARFLERCLERMQEVREAGTTVVLVTHSLPEVRRQCTRCLWINRGLLVDDGEPEAVLAAYEEYVHTTGGALTDRTAH
ncbi:MAG: ABC transporter ATP-binding protein [bacterium]|nr:ABC transporter ATP-binding protein [bacterium]